MLYLLPNRFKKAGWIFICLPLILGILFEIIKPEFYLDNKIKFLNNLKIFALLGLLLVIITKSKFEDEYVEHCRLKSFVFSFVISVVITIINMTGLFDERLKSGFDIISTMMISYLLWFYLQTWNIKKSA